MIVRKFDEVKSVACPYGGFYSRRFLTKKDNMGFTLTHTFIPAGREENWHYKNHFEACFCISGEGEVKIKGSDVSHKIEPGTMYALNENDNHIFTSFTDVVLVCVFNPPLNGEEVHGKDGSYDV